MALPITIKKLTKMKEKGERFTMLTAYDATQARLCEQAGIDMLLVGDSLGMVVQGERTTVSVSVDSMIYHAKAVAKGAPNTIKMVDMPFMSYADYGVALKNAARLMQEGSAEILKLECSIENAMLLDLVTKLGHNGVPVCVHLGLTPQTIQKLGSYQQCGKNDSEAEKILHAAKMYEQAGADMILLECVPSALAKKITESVKIPVIGIGAGKYVDAQVLVIYDILGMSTYIPSFAKNFLSQNASIESAIRQFVTEVKGGVFPSDKNTTR